MWASKAGHLDVAKVLVENGAFIDAKDKLGKLVYITIRYHAHVSIKIIQPLKIIENQLAGSVFIYLKTFVYFFSVKIPL